MNQTPREWEKEFRQIIIENNDLNVGGLNRSLSTGRPVKGDIYFDGIEIEKFISNLINSAIETEREQVLDYLECYNLPELDGPISGRQYLISQKRNPMPKKNTVEKIKFPEKATRSFPTPCMKCRKLGRLCYKCFVEIRNY